MVFPGAGQPEEELELTSQLINFNADQRISHQDDQEHEEEEEEELVENWLMKRVLEHFVSLASNTSL